MTVKVNEEECTGCGSCVDECPAEAITLNDDDIAVIDQDECTECGTCVDVCPSEAITMDD
ncbi:MAG: 4Fe-4S binding protein [Euryarchaeota archaeon]|nr:4Fe-4S binding protein [Euryarchaeota archaeon]